MIYTSDEPVAISLVSLCLINDHSLSAQNVMSVAVQRAHPDYLPYL